MQLLESEEELFARWRANLPAFVTDGAVDPQSYVRSTPKILLLLKEVNDPGGGGWCLRDFLRKGGRAETWDNVTRWIHAIRSLPQEVGWDELRVVTEAQRRDVLQSVAAVNLKKLPGGHTTEVRAFWPAVQQDAEYLRQQFALYDADLVLCCGSLVAGAFDAFIKAKEAGPWRSTSRGVDYLEYAPGKFVIGYSHPEARVAANLLHYGLIDTVRQLLGRGYVTATG